MSTFRYVPALLALLVAGPTMAQEVERVATNTNEPTAASETDSTAAAAPSTAPSIQIQHIRPYDQRGINVFEAPKNDAVPYTGFRLDWSAAFSQPFQSLDHSNTAQAVMSGTPAVNANELKEIGAGFNLAQANLVLNAQVAPGIRVNLESYLSTRRHNETWVKGGYLQVDESPIDLPILHSLMDYVTLKVGMFEINYGDAHFRRSDAGQVLYNAFAENNILDSFNTEIGAEAYVRTGPFLAMVGVSDGQNKGGITTPDDRSYGLWGKVGFDQQIHPLLRVRLTGSMYNVEKTPAANLFNGDRGGSHYFLVLENAAATTTANATSGRINPGLSNSLNAYQINPFVKLAGLELFGVIEHAEGKAFAETENRAWDQYAAEAVYRFLPNEQLFVGAKWNQAEGRLRNYTSDVTVERKALVAGWFLTPNVLLKGEYVTQSYDGFLPTDIRNGGKFDGFVVEAGLAF